VKAIDMATSSLLATMSSKGTKEGPFALCFLLPSSLRILFCVVSLRLWRTACCVVILLLCQPAECWL